MVVVDAFVTFPEGLIYMFSLVSQSVSMAKLNSKSLKGICDLMGENPTKSQAT